MMIDAYEIYGHDPTDKLDHLAHYQIEMMKIKRAPDQVLFISYNFIHKSLSVNLKYFFLNY